MRRKGIIWLKLAAIAGLTLLFIRLIVLDENTIKKKQPEGTPVRREEVEILTEELTGFLGAELKRDFTAIWKQGFSGQESSEDMSYESYVALLEFLEQRLPETDRKAEVFQTITYEEKYRQDFYLLKEDWYESYEQLLFLYGLEDRIRKEEAVLLCRQENLVGMEKGEEKCILDIQGKTLPYEDSAFEYVQFGTALVYRTEERLLTLLEIREEMLELPGVLLLEAGESEICFFYKGYEMMCGYDPDFHPPIAVREQMADLSFREGMLTAAKVLDQRVSGKLLSVSETAVELEGAGIYEFAEECTGYQLYEALREVQCSELSPGYDFADFVVEDGRIRGFLLLCEERMENIRVAIESSGFGGLYHDEIVLSCGDCDMTLYYGSYENRKQVKIPRGEKLTLKKGGDYLSGDRVRAEPSLHSARICVESLERNRGTPSYRGQMEVLKREEGLVLINEVLLEEYLYSVVPSEMPASYPSEALKAQAVCARTYACRYLHSPGLAALGAHVDDSVGYQVYNNIEENVNTTRAVRETAGEILLYEEKPASAYYYSTSCGYGTDAGVWSAENRETMPYLKSRYVADPQEKGQDNEKEKMQEEETFREYITAADPAAWEKEEPWFRWEYRVEELDGEILSQRLKERYEAAPDRILTLADDREASASEKADPKKEIFARKEPEGFKKVYGITGLKRGEGGVMEELLIETEQGTYKVISEYNIRYILNQGGTLTRQDGSRYENGSLLPSAYIIIDVVKSGKNVIGYKITGGGYGHGVGMSQNGAKAMALAGMDWKEILGFFYEGCRIMQADELK